MIGIEIENRMVCHHIVVISFLPKGVRNDKPKADASFPLGENQKMDRHDSTDKTGSVCA